MNLKNKNRIVGGKISMRLKIKIKKNIMIACFIFFSVSCMADNKIDEKYQKIISNIKEAQKNGKFIGYFDDNCNVVKEKKGAKYYRILHEKNNGIYLITQYDLSGTLDEIYQATDEYDCWGKDDDSYNRREGKTISFFKNGTKLREANYKNGKLEGKEYWYNQDGKIEWILEYKNNIQNGKEIRYFGNGKIETEENFKNGERNGEGKYYHEDGRLVTVTNYLDGIVHGKNVTYYKNGKTKSETMYKNGEVEGKWVEYNENGSIKDQGEVINGNGEFRTYFESGKLHSKTIYKNGKRKYIEYYENGKFKGSLTFDEDGGITGEGENVYYTE